MKLKLNFSFFNKDFPAGIVVFFVALPLCLGVALASGAPLFAGIIAGIVGGVVVGLFSGSNLGVSGPAAGLTVIVAGAISSLGNYQVFLSSVVLAGVFQIIFGVLGAGKVAFFFPSSVIKGMLSAIGVIIILKQIPHAFGLDKDEEGDFSFLQHDGQNTFSELLQIGEYSKGGALLIGVFSIVFLYLWDKFAKKSVILSKIPGALICVILGILINNFYPVGIKLEAEHLVKLPVLDNFSEVGSLFTFPDFTQIFSFTVIKVAAVIAVIASLETLLCVEATDKLDPDRNITPTNQELIAQGIGNTVSGLIGGIPLTQVIVRSSANIQAEGKTKLASIFHGLLLALTVIFIPKILNQIPLATLAAVLVLVGYKLASPKIIKGVWKDGLNQFIPYMVTLLAIVFTDLLTGIIIGLIIGIGFVLYTNGKSAFKSEKEGNITKITFLKDAFFFNRAQLAKILSNVVAGDHLVFDGTKAKFIDFDLYSTLTDFKDEAYHNDVKVELINIDLKKTK